jgi:hypothetical protein
VVVPKYVAINREYIFQAELKYVVFWAPIRPTASTVGGCDACKSSGNVDSVTGDAANAVCRGLMGVKRDLLNISFESNTCFIVSVIVSRYPGFRQEVLEWSRGSVYTKLSNEWSVITMEV